MKNLSIQDLDKVLKALGDVNRIRILKMLMNKKMCVCELAFVLGVSQPAVSKQLKKMLSAGLVDFEQDGFWTNYFISSKNLYAKKLLGLLSQWLNDEGIVREDLLKAKNANRKKLCFMK